MQGILLRANLGLISGIGTMLITGCGTIAAPKDSGEIARKKAIVGQMDEGVRSDFRDLETPDPAELRALAADPKKDPRRLMWLINRAGAVKDSSFKDLPSRAELRSSDTGVYLALLGYDYSVNGDQKSLDKLLARLKTEPQGGDSSTVLTLSFVDEWQRSPAAVTHFYRRTDGAGGLSRVLFWKRRELYFPEHYDSYKGGIH